MTHDPRPHIHRRRDAIGRLRSLTTGVAIAGIAGTAGFAALAATTWSGDPAATGATGAIGATGVDETGNGTTGTGRTGGAAATPRPRLAPTSGGTAQNPTTTTPRVGRATSPGHAASGGSH